MDWRNLKIDGISSIKKLVAEFHVYEDKYSPDGFLIIKVYEDQNGRFTGSLNLEIKSETGVFLPYGSFTRNSIEEALVETIKTFFEVVDYKPAEEWKEEDFRYIPWDEF